MHLGSISGFPTARDCGADVLASASAARLLERSRGRHAAARRRMAGSSERAGGRSKNLS